MGFKYVMFQVTHGSLTRNIPVIFPDVLAHVDIAEAVERSWRASHSKAKVAAVPIRPVSAGFVELPGDSITTHGSSETLKMHSRPEDGKIIELFPYIHGIES